MSSRPRATPRSEEERKRIGKRIAEARRQRLGLTQAELAHQLEITTDHLARVERGDVNASDLLLRRIAEHLGATLTWLLREDDDARAYPAASPNKQAVIDSNEFKKAPDSVKEWFLTLQRSSGDLSQVGWAQALGIGLDLYEKGLLESAGAVARLERSRKRDDER